MGRERVELPRCVWEFREEKEVSDLKSNTPFAQERSPHANLLRGLFVGTCKTGPRFPQSFSVYL